MENMIKVESLTKIFKLYSKNSDRLKEAVSLKRRKFYEDFYALNDVSFEVHKGETLGILGKNGSGKSTLLKIITGVLTPSSGKIKINGKVAALLELGAGFNPEYTGIENIYLNGLLLGRTREEMDNKLSDILDFADIGDFVNQPVKNYSSGMFARLAFAVAINVEPEVLIIDEALSVGDVFFQQKCFERIKKMKADGVTILFVSHDVTSISSLCDRCVLLNNGEVYSIGQPRVIINDYVKLYNTNEDLERKLKKTEQKTDMSLSKMMSKEIEEYRYGDKTAVIQKIECLNNLDLDNNWLVYTLEEFKFKISIDFFEDCMNPIVAFYIKNKKGLEMYSGNTHYLGKNIGPVKQGSKVTVTFLQRMLLAPDEYVVSIGVSDFIDGNSRPLDRRYDVDKITVKSERTVIGIMDMNSKIDIFKDE